MYWINGIINKKISLNNRALHFGDGFFTTARVNNGKIDFLEYHVSRLNFSAKKLMFNNFNINIVRQEMKNAAIVGMYGFIKVIISRQNSGSNIGSGYYYIDDIGVSRIIYTGHIPKHYLKWLKFGIKIKTSIIRLARNHCLAGIKHINRLEQVMIANWIHKNNTIDEALVLDTEGNVVECCSANIFWRIGKQVFTPSVRYAGISGIMRQLILELLPKLGYLSQEVIVDPKHIKNADEVFITNSLLPIVSVNIIDDVSYKEKTLFYLLNAYLKNII